MRKLVLFTILSIVALCFAASAYAGTLKPGQKMTCNNASKITLEADGTSSQGDRGNANAVIWKSSNATTVPISLGPTDDQGFAGERSVGMADKFSKGRHRPIFVKRNSPKDDRFVPGILRLAQFSP